MAVFYKSDFLLVMVSLCFFSLVLNIGVVLFRDKSPSVTKLYISPDRHARVIREYLERSEENQRQNIETGATSLTTKEERRISPSYFTTESFRTREKYNKLANYSSYKFPAGADKKVSKTMSLAYLYDYYNMVDSKTGWTSYDDSRDFSAGLQWCTIYNFKKEAVAKEITDCRPLAVKPPVIVCLYPNEQDTHVSRQIRRSGAWEPHIIKQIQDLLNTDADYGFIDIGAHIGMYTLTAATMGHKVVAVEPFRKNAQHIHKAAVLGGIQSNVIVVKNAISNVRWQTVLFGEDENKGGMRLGDTDKFADCGVHLQNCTSESNIQTIYMDDLLEVVKFKKAIVKVDIEGHECKAFHKSDHIFRKIFITHIFMEWLKVKHYFGGRSTKSLLKDLTFDLVLLLRDRGYTAHCALTGEELSIKRWFTWPDDIVWKHKNA